MKSNTLYHGDNGSHEFWQSEGAGYLLLRNHQEKHWSAHNYYARGGVGFIAFGTLDELVSRLGVVLSRSRVFSGSRLVLAGGGENG